MIPSIRSMLIAAGTVVALASDVRAQASITGLVRDSTGRRVAGAEVAIAALSRATQTDDSGRFVLTNLAPGLRLVRVRRIGYSAFSQMVQVASGENRLGDVVLAPVVVRLDSVFTRDQMLLREDPLLREFEENRKVGLGHFVTRAELAKQEGRKMSEILAQLTSSIHIIYGLGNQAWVATARRGQVQTQAQSPGVKLKQSNCPGIRLEDETQAPPNYCSFCYAQVYLDATRLSTFDFPNINRQIPAQVESIEYYAGGGQTPQRYATLNSECGVVVFHTRRPP